MRIEKTHLSFCLLRPGWVLQGSWVLAPLRVGTLLWTAAVAAAKSSQSCPTLCDPIAGSPPGFPVPGILQARTLEWVAISFFNAWKWIRSVVSDSLRPHESQHTRPPYPSPTLGAYSNSCPSNRWCHPAISSSVFPFSFNTILPL